MQIIKEKIEFEKSLKQRLDFICEFSNVTPTFINGSIRKIDKTNLSYIEPHRVIVKGITFLFFNYSNFPLIFYMHPEAECFENTLSLRDLCSGH